MAQLRRMPFALIVFLILTGHGCATLKTLPSLYTSGSPKVFSGTRLDVRTLNKDFRLTKKLNITPPEHPLIDLPFSLVFDILLIPVTSPVGLYEWLFES